MIRVGIAGFGKMGKIRYEAITKNPRLVLTSVYEPNSNIVMPSDILRVNSLDELLYSSNIDAIIVCCPNYLMKEYVIRSLNSGKHVFCEKPPGINLKETLEMKSVLSTKPLKLMFGFNHRHHESIKYAKNLINSNSFGSVLWMRGRYGKSVPDNFYDDWRSKKELAGGGIFLDQGIHMLDLFMHITGPFDEIHSFVSNLYWKGDIEDNVFAIFRNKKGQVASLHSTMTQWRHLFSFEIFLENGYIVINGIKTSSNSYGKETVSVVYNRSKAPAASFSDQITTEYPVDNSWEVEMNNFEEAISQDREIESCGINDAVNLMQMVDKIYEK